jgi:hypothetical protein
MTSASSYRLAGAGAESNNAVDRRCEAFMNEQRVIRRALSGKLFRTRRSLREISAEARRRTAAFEQLNSLNANDKKQVRQLVRHHENHLSVAEVCNRKTERVLQVSGMVASATCGYVLPVIAISRWAGFHRSVFWSLPNVFFVMLAYMIVAGPLLFNGGPDDRDLRHLCRRGSGSQFAFVWVISI